MVIDNKTNCVQQTINVSFKIKSFISERSHAGVHCPIPRTFLSLEKSVEIQFRKFIKNQ